MTPAPEPFFLKAEPGERFCLYHAPDKDKAAAGLVVLAPPFAEELNKSRRMLALQARALTARGYAVLQIDLFGCGDSAGQLAAARWDIWKSDLAHACSYGLTRHPGALILGGLRLGALLALDFATDGPIQVSGLLLWQPVLSGEAHMRQFLRLQNVQQMMATVPSHSQEVVGYTLSQQLHADLKAIDAGLLQPRCPVTWLELVTAPDLPAPSARLIGKWRRKGISVQAKALSGPHFWATNEVTTCPELLQATLDALPAPGARS